MEGNNCCLVSSQRLLNTFLDFKGAKELKRVFIDINIKEEYVKFVSILGQREKALNAEVTYAIFYV